MYAVHATRAACREPSREAQFGLRRGSARGGCYILEAWPDSIWTGTISFGLVTVPVKLYSAVSRKTVRFHQLHESTGARIQQKRVDPQTGEEVPYDEIVKGYEIAPDRYVIVKPDELEALDPKKTRTIDIEDFVDLDDIDPIFYDHPYYLAPGPGRRQALPAAARGDARDEQGRHRARRHPLQGEPRRDPPDGRRAGDDDDDLRRRGRRPRPHRRHARPRRGQGDRPRAGHRQAARRVAGGRLRARTSTTTPTARRSSPSSSARRRARRSPSRRRARRRRRPCPTS